ncbi:MAG TPA: DUF502 domain-containing protein [Polyangiaceae bacterium]|nr:DUF502 domain-containing protein [Polyangiaceae bacterium]
MGKRVIRYFVRGCLVSVPLAVTGWLIFVTLRFIDQLLPLGIPGLGLVVTLTLVTLIGLLTSNVIGRSVFQFTDRLLSGMPLVKLLYNSIKDLIRAFVGDHKSFDQPAAVALTPGGARVLGFVTRDALHMLGMPDFVAVYFPQSYNFAGQLAVVPRSQVELLDAPSAEVMTFIVSGGISGFGRGQSLVPPPTLTSVNIKPEQRG